MRNTPLRIKRAKAEIENVIRTAATQEQVDAVTKLHTAVEVAEQRANAGDYVTAFNRVEYSMEQFAEWLYRNIGFHAKGMHALRAANRAKIVYNTVLTSRAVTH